MRQGFAMNGNSALKTTKPDINPALLAMKT